MMHRLISSSGPQSSVGGAKEEREVWSVGGAKEDRGVWSVAEHFQCSRGFIQSSITAVASFAVSLAHFTEVRPCAWLQLLAGNSYTHTHNHISSCNIPPTALVSHKQL